jgi:NitT/TauT family transport system substrate-binding protein
MSTKISMENVFPFQDLAVLVAHHEGLFAEEGLEIEFVRTPGLWQVPVDQRVTDPESVSAITGHASRCEAGKATMYNACEWGNYRRAQDSGVGARQLGRRASVAPGALIDLDRQREAHTLARRDA